MKLAASEIRIFGLPGIPEIVPGADLSALIAPTVAAAGLRIVAGDIFIVAQKIVSKAEGQLVQLDLIEPSERARQWAAQFQKDARFIEVVLQQARRIVRMERGIIIAETKHGFICANAGVDNSNVAPGTAALLPDDPDQSAKRLRAEMEGIFGVALGVIISDTFGRPWREGLANVALGVSGLAPLVDYRGRFDTFNRKLQATVMAVADELASAAELVMGKTGRVPVALIQGFRSAGAAGSGRDLIRPAAQDLFR